MREISGEIVAASVHQSLLHRKVTLEAVRARRDLSGYVVTGEADTPISTPGMWDDLGRSKFEPDAFRAFNDDLVLLIGWDRQRSWDAGGDRPAFWDPYNYPGRGDGAGSSDRLELCRLFVARPGCPGRPPAAGKAPFARG